MTRRRIADLFCKAGGAAMGYHRAGFEVIGFDIEPQPNYPFEFHQADALKVDLSGFDAAHASPPCQHYSTVSGKSRGKHPALIGPTRERLIASGLPWVIENVIGAPLIEPVRYCGSSFGLDLRRHRLFESSEPLSAPACDHGWQTPRFRSLDGRMVAKGILACVVGVHGHINYAGEFALRCAAMGIDWMTNAELVDAIPPAYTEHIGAQMLAALDLEEAA